MKILRALVLVFLAAGALRADDDHPPHFQAGHLVLSTGIKGWSGHRPEGPQAVYAAAGVSFLMATSNGIGSTQSWDLTKPPSLDEAHSDPLKLVEYVSCLVKKGQLGEVLKLMDPSTDPEDKVILSRPDLVKAEYDLYSDKTTGHVLLAFTPDAAGHILVAYQIEGATGSVMRIESICKVGETYALAGSTVRESTNGPRAINVYTALYDAMHGKPGEIQFVPGP
jgi:hypothetical protein